MRFHTQVRVARDRVRHDRMRVGSFDRHFERTFNDVMILQSRGCSFPETQRLRRCNRDHGAKASSRSAAPPADDPFVVLVSLHEAGPR